MLWLLLSVGRSASCVLHTTSSTYCGIQQDEQHSFAHQTLEAGVIFVCQHIVEVAWEDAYLVNDQLLWWQKNHDVLKQAHKTTYVN